MNNNIVFGLLLLVPFIGVISSGLLKFPLKRLLTITAVLCGLEFFAATYLFAIVYKSETVLFCGKLFFADALSALTLLMVTFSFFISSIYSIGYFGSGKQNFDLKNANRYLLLWNLFLLVLTLVLLSNNLGIMWVSLEASTLSSAFLILTRGIRSSVEAMWKYLLICSVGIAFGLIGTILLFAASDYTLVESTLLWTELRAMAGSFDKGVMIAAFVFILIGFGTKAGLAPMHTWLPDAYSEAPTPVSAVFSSGVLTCSLYCIFRYLPLTEAAIGNSGQARYLLLFFGLLSVFVAMIFIPAQRDIKRLLAYSSIENVGIIAVGIALGGTAVIGGLLHMLYHSIAKMMTFLSAGKIAHTYGTRDMKKINGSIKSDRLWGICFFISAMTLFGTAPFALFTSELTIFRSAFELGRYRVFTVLLCGIALIFIAATKHVFSVSFGDPGNVQRKSYSLIEKIFVFVLTAPLLVLGLYIPEKFWEVLKRAAEIITG